MDIGALWKYRCNPFQCCSHGEGRHTVKWSRLQPGIRQDPGGLRFCLDSSWATGSKDCLSTDRRSYLHTDRTVGKVTHIHKHAVDCMREHPCTWTCFLSCPQHVVSPCCLNVNKSENMILDRDDELKTFLNEAVSFYLVVHLKTCLYNKLTLPWATSPAFCSVNVYLDDKTSKNDTVTFGKNLLSIYCKLLHLDFFL